MTVINVLRALMEKVDNMQEQTGNVSRNIQTLKKRKEKKNARNQHHNRNAECLQQAR